jgi:RHS repeat-associated protein
LYAADGKKLSSRYVTLVPGIFNPLNPGQVIDGLDVNENDFVTIEGMDYINNIEYKVSRIFDWDVSFEPKDNISIKRVHNGEGYAEGVTYVTEGNEPAYSYYRRDHLGNNREVWCASYIRNNSVRPEKTMQRTQYYPSGLPWAESTGQGAQPYKHNGKEFIETHGYDVTDHGNRGIHHATNRYTTMDRFAEKFPWQSPYAHAGNNPVNNIDLKGDSAWNITNQWNNDYITGYFKYVINQTQKYIDAGQQFTCEDFALSLLIDYASTNGLPVTIQNGSGTYDARSDNYTDMATFKNDVLMTTGARDLQNPNNTIETKIMGSKSGDIIINRNDNNIGHHIQVITAPEIDGVVGISQGNSGILNGVRVVSGVLNAGNPRSLFYTGKSIERGSYDINAGVYFNQTTGKIINNYRTVKNIDVRRWNFKTF